MPRPLSFDHLQAILRQHTTALPDVRKPSPNTRYTIQNAALGQYLRHLGRVDCMVNPPQLSDLGNRLINKNRLWHFRKAF